VDSSNVSIRFWPLCAVSQETFNLKRWPTVLVCADGVMDINVRVHWDGAIDVPFGLFQDKAHSPQCVYCWGSFKCVCALPCPLCSSASPLRLFPCGLIEADGLKRSWGCAVYLASLRHPCQTAQLNDNELKGRPCTHTYTHTHTQHKVVYLLLCWRDGDCCVVLKVSIPRCSAAYRSALSFFPLYARPPWFFVCFLYLPWIVLMAIHYASAPLSFCVNVIPATKPIYITCVHIYRNKYEIPENMPIYINI